MTVVNVGSRLTPALLNPLYIRKSVNESLSLNASLQDDDALVLPVLASAIYKVTAHIRYTAGGAVAANGIKMGWSGPVGATFEWVGHSKIDSDGANAATSIWMAGLDITSTVSSGGAGGVTLVASPNGYLTTSAAGSLRFRWSQHTSSATATVVLAGSWLDLERRF